jgi:hypothetical protein
MDALRLALGYCRGCPYGALGHELHGDLWRPTHSTVMLWNGWGTQIQCLSGSVSLWQVAGG